MERKEHKTLLDLQHENFLKTSSEKKKVVISRTAELKAIEAFMRAK